MSRVFTNNIYQKSYYNYYICDQSLKITIKVKTHVYIYFVPKMFNKNGDSAVSAALTIAMALFQPQTAMGKLKADIIPTTPSGLYISMSAWPGLSEGKTEPPSIRDRPTAQSQMSTYSCTSPTPSGRILPGRRRFYLKIRTT